MDDEFELVDDETADGQYDEFDKWFRDEFPDYVRGGAFLEPYYSVAHIAYDKGCADCFMDRG